MRSITITAFACLLAAAPAAQSAAQDVATYSGPCDASAAVAVDADHFAVGNDENDTLYVYRRGVAKAVATLDLSTFLGTTAGEEADIEGAAVVGTRIYWITSHGRNSKGKAQPSRRRFFATEIRPGAPPVLEPVGAPYVDLLRDMGAADALKPYKLAQAAKLAPETEGGFNIEGLAAGPDGGLLIGLRSPLPHRHALVVPLENPGELIEGKTARFGAPIELDLGGRGIRSIELVRSGYLIVAGPPADAGGFEVYRWSGRPGEPPAPVEGLALGDLRPEALFAIPHSGHAQLLSDDGGVIVGGVECKTLPPAQQTFRSLAVKP
jgi:hypothetical protein